MTSSPRAAKRRGRGMEMFRISRWAGGGHVGARVGGGPGPRRPPGRPPHVGGRAGGSRGPGLFRLRRAWGDPAVAGTCRSVGLSRPPGWASAGAPSRVPRNRVRRVTVFPAPRKRTLVGGRLAPDLQPPGPVGAPRSRPVAPAPSALLGLLVTLTPDLQFPTPQPCCCHPAPPLPSLPAHKPLSLASAPHSQPAAPLLPALSGQPQLPLSQLGPSAATLTHAGRGKASQAPA